MSLSSLSLCCNREEGRKVKRSLGDRALVGRAKFFVPRKMMNQDEYADDEEMNITHKSSNVSQSVDKNDHLDIPLCGCLSVRYYQSYFDIDTVDVISRISNAMFYCKREDNFLSRVKDKPDAYGPFWIATTLIFTLAVTSHINSWLSSWMQGKNWYGTTLQIYLSLSHLLTTFIA